MFNRITTYTIIIILSVCTAQLLQAQTAVGIKAGTTGIGVEVAYSLHDQLNLRGSGSFFSYKRSGVAQDEIDYHYRFNGNIRNAGAVADYFPFNEWFKISGGVYYHSFVVDGKLNPNEPYELEGKVFQPEKMGQLTGQVDYRHKIVPYLGLGIGNAVNPGGRVSFGLDMGAMFTSSPNIDMQGEGMVAPTANQEDMLEDAVYSFKLYPVISLSIKTRL